VLSTNWFDHGAFGDTPALVLWSDNPDDFRPLAAAVRGLIDGTITSFDLESLATWDPESSFSVEFRASAQNDGTSVDFDSSRLVLSLTPDTWRDNLYCFEGASQKASSWEGFYLIDFTPVDEQGWEVDVAISGLQYL